MMNFSKWISRSLLGHVVFFQIIFSLPASIYGLVSNYTQGTLTVPFAVEMMIVVSALGAVGAAAVWYTITLPIINRTKK